MTKQTTLDPLPGEAMSREEFIRRSGRWIAGGVLVAGGALLGFRKPGKETVDCPPGAVCSQCRQSVRCKRRQEAGDRRQGPAAPENSNEGPERQEG